MLKHVALAQIKSSRGLFESRIGDFYNIPLVMVVIACQKIQAIIS